MTRVAVTEPGLLTRLTIRARITGGSLLIAILISIVAGIVIFTQVSRIVNDGQLAVLENVEAPYLTALAVGADGDLDQPGSDQLVTVVDPDGTAPIDTLPAGLSRELDDVPRVSGETDTIRVGRSSYLVRITEVSTSDGNWRVISAIANDQQVSVLNQVAALLISAIAGINLAFGASTWLIGTAALRPVERLRRSAAALVAEPGDRLLPVGPAEDEIAHLARTLNELIAALRASAERERQIVSDASHELRTPLAILQTQLELAQIADGSLDRMRADVGAAQRTLTRLISLATSLLELSRIDANTASGSSTVSELALEVADAADRSRLRVAGSDILIDYEADISSDETVAIDQSDFGRIVDNLVSNAVTAIHDHGRVVLRLDSLGGDLVHEVAHDGGGMREEFVAQAFDRFSQADRARTGSGAGLGLPIVSGLVNRARGRTSIANRPGVGVTVKVTLPLTPAA